VALVETRTQVKNRVTKILEATNIKVAHVVSDVSGTSGRRTRAVLMAGERAPQTLAARDANLFGAHVAVTRSVPGEKRLGLDMWWSLARTFSTQDHDAQKRRVSTARRILWELHILCASLSVALKKDTASVRTWFTMSYMLAV
jgi:hypothetical protein